MTSYDQLTPRQQDTLRLLRRPSDDLPDFTGVAGALLERLAAEIDPMLDRWDGLGRGELRLTKWHLSGCERRRVEDNAQFEWTPEKATGTLVHQMIQTWCFDHDNRPPPQVFELAADRVKRDETSIGRWLGETEAMTEVRERCCSLFTQFVEVFPKPTRSMVPAVETRHVLRHRALYCEAKVDLQLGADEGTRAGVVLVELKSGAMRPEYVEDLRHYALLRAVRVGTPPRAVALCSVAEGVTHVEQVTARTLNLAADRLVTAVEQAVSLAEGRPPAETPSGLCRWCAVLDRCPSGQQVVR